jgi:uncharacterized protein YdaU (DUF1376 family)
MPSGDFLLKDAAIMARTKPPSFDFFPDDFIAGTYHLPAEAVGIYVRLLCYQWNNGSIPSDENELARVAGVDADAMRTHMRTVMLKFMPDGCGGLKNARLEREREHKLSVIEKSKSAADSRWTKEKARKAAEAANRPGCGGNADAHADAHADAYADAMRTDMPPTSNVQLPTSIDLKPPLSPKGETAKPPKEPRKPKETIGEFDIPPRLDSPEVREALEAWERMRRNIGHPIRDRGNVCRGWDQAYRDRDHLLACINLTTANEWQGIKPSHVDPKAKPKVDPYANLRKY